MPSSVSIGSPAEFSKLLSSSTIVIADCTSPTSPALPHQLTPLSLRRLVWTMQDYRTHLRVPRSEILEAK